MAEWVAMMTLLGTMFSKILMSKYPESFDPAVPELILVQNSSQTELMDWISMLENWCSPTRT